MKEVNHECYVSLEVAKLLREAGFDWKVNHSYPDYESLDNSCSGYMEELSFYHNLNDGKYGGISVPTLDIAQRWLREVKELHVNVDTWPAALWRWVVWKINPERKIVASEHSNYKTYEEAQEAGIKKALELILEKGK